MPDSNHISISPLNDDQFDFRGINGDNYDKDLTPEQFYRIIVDNTSDMERWVSPERELLYISPSCEKITGYTVGEHMREPELMMKIIHPEDKDWVLKQRDDSFSGKIHEQNEVRIITKNGSVRWISIVANKVTGNDGSDLGFRTSSRDITDKKRLEFQLEEERKRYFQILNLQSDLVAMSNPDTSLTFANNAYARLVGRDPHEIVGIPWLSFIPAGDLGRHRKFLTSITPENSVETIENQTIDSNGKIRWLQWITRGIFDQEGNLLEYQSVGRDMTEIKLLNEKILADEALYRSLVENQSDLVLRHTIEGVSTYINKSFLSFMNMKKEEVIGKNWRDWIRKDLVDKIEKIHASLSTLQPVACEVFHLENGDREKRYVEFVNQGIFNNEGHLIEIQVVGQDITELKKTEMKLVKALEEVYDLKKKLEDENRYLREKVVYTKSKEGLISNSRIMQEILDMATEVSGTDSPVLLTGETGTGKEVLGHFIHNLSKRRKKMMITVNCGALPPSLIESELFGREKGAYTGALSRQIGRFELAHQSTIFLDEIGELPLDLQVKLLRIIQSGEFQMLGSPETRKVDVRIIAATNRSLEKEVEQGTFRKDLFYRLNVFPIHLPPLRDRKEDLPMLAWGFIDEISARMGKTIEKISNLSMNRMLNYHWPGNIRELRNILEYSIILCKSHVLEVKLPDMEIPPETSDSLDSTQRLHIEKVLNQTGWRVRGEGGAAEILGMKESTLRARMKKLGIQRGK